MSHCTHSCSTLKVIAALVSVEWVLYAFSIAFDTGGMVKGGYNLRSFFGSLGSGGLHTVRTHRLGPSTYPLNTLAMFQLTFAIITVAIISGAYVERMKHSAVMLFSSLWLVAVYCPLAHMVWSGDGAFLHDLGVLDFAGGLVVHTSSGVAGLVCALCIRQRTGYPRIPKAPHSLVLTHIGAAFLWVGWFGFNAGSAGAADFSAAQALMVTQVASSAGVLAWSAFEWFLFKRPSSLGMLSGALAGLVGITPASGSSGVYGALFIGSFCAVVTFLASTRLKEWLGLYDDALDAFGIHAVGGIFGALWTGVWCSPSLGGIGYGNFVHKGGRTEAITNIGWQLGMQAVSVAFVVPWVVIGTLLALKVTDLLHGGFHCRLHLTHIRVTKDQEALGLDESLFAETGYQILPSDMRISVELGPLRGREGHGLHLSMVDDDGTQHPIMLHNESDKHDSLAAELFRSGGVVSLVGSPDKTRSFRCGDVSTRGASAAGHALQLSEVTVYSSSGPGSGGEGRVHCGAVAE